MIEVGMGMDEVEQKRKYQEFQEPFESFIVVS